MNKKEFKELDKEQMTSEEIIKECEELIKEINSHKDKDFIGRLYYKNRPVEELLKGLLDLYKQEKEKNKKIKIELEVEKTDNIYNKEETTEETIPKYKIREKIKELEKELKEFQELDFISEAAKRHQQIQVLNDILEEK